MKITFPVIAFMITSTFSFAQTEKKSEITMTSEFGSSHSELTDILQFEGIAYLKLKFQGKELATKSYHLSVKEIWDGVVKSDSTIINSAEIGIEQFQTINDSVFSLRVISKLTEDHKLKMVFKFPRFSTSRKFDAIDSEDYSLRNVAEASGTDIQYGERFYLLAYILPYEKDGRKYWCAVENSGKDIENWGKEFGIKHYLVFEMLFE